MNAGSIRRCSPCVYTLRARLRCHGWVERDVGSKVRALGATLACDEDADPFDHLSRRACSLGKENVCAACAIAGSGSVGDDHRGQRGLQLFRAPDELVAVHLRHVEVAEQKVERSGDGRLNDFERVLG